MSEGHTASRRLERWRPRSSRPDPPEPRAGVDICRPYWCLAGCKRGPRTLNAASAKFATRAEGTASTSCSSRARGRPSMSSFIRRLLGSRRCRQSGLFPLAIPHKLPHEGVEWRVHDCARSRPDIQRGTVSRRFVRRSPMWTGPSTSPSSATATNSCATSPTAISFVRISE